MHNEMIQLLDTIKAEYTRFMTRNGKITELELANHQKDMIVDFALKLDYTEGKKYIKVMTGNSVWGFIVKGDNDKKFRKGDILKAAGYNAPARNHARGNIIDGGYTICWTGPHYMTK
jgi:hypothetical protein